MLRSTERSGAKFLRIGRSGAEHKQSAPERGAEHFFLPSHSSANRYTILALIIAHNYLYCISLGFYGPSYE